MDMLDSLVQSGHTSPGVLMRSVYRCESLRRRGTIEKQLPDLYALLTEIKTLEEDLCGGSGVEDAESEGCYVRMFDLLHRLVKIKVITQGTVELWSLFMDLRNRFSFASSDQEWARYRDNRLALEAE